MSFEINGKTFLASPQAGHACGHFLRQLGHFGVKKGCDAGDCGRLHGADRREPVHSCLIPAFRADGHRGDHHRRFCARRRPPSDAAGVFSMRGISVRVCTAGMILTCASLKPGTAAGLGASLKGTSAAAPDTARSRDALTQTNVEDDDAGTAFGRSLPRPPTKGGARRERYTFDIARKACCTSRCCARRIRTRKSFRSTRAKHSALPACHTVLTYEDAPVPAVLDGAGTKKTGWIPKTPKVLDNVVRFIGQKVAAVVARPRPLLKRAPPAQGRVRTSPARGRSRAERSRRARPRSTATRRSRIASANSARNIVAETHGEFGVSRQSLAQAAVTYQGTFTTQRVQHAALETHGGHCLGRCRTAC